MKEIPLTQVKIALVDDEDFENISKFKWHTNKVGNTFYAVSDSHPDKGNRCQIRMHQVLLTAPKGKEIDHINGNGLDNRRENIRIVTHRQNLQNWHGKKSSKYPGVHWHKQKQKWRAQIKISGKIKEIGHYDNEEDAAKAYEKANNEIMGIRSRGKPLGTRQKIGLYTQILDILKQDKEQGGDGYTAFAISSYLGATHQTTQRYLADLVEQKQVKQHKFSNINMVLFSIK